MMTIPVAILSALVSLAVISEAAPVKEFLPIASKEWSLVRLTIDEKTVPLGASKPLPTLTIGLDGKVSGKSAVNRYFGSIVLNGAGDCEWSGGLGATRMAGPPAAMKLESEVLKALPQTSKVDLTDGVLTLASADGKLSAVFMSEMLEGKVVFSKQPKATLAPGTEVSVSLQDVSLADAPSQTISTAAIVDAGKFPVTFRLPYSKGLIKPGRTYTLSARIELAGKLLYINDTAHPVFQNGNAPKGPMDLKVIAVNK